MSRKGSFPLSNIRGGSTQQGAAKERSWETGVDSPVDHGHLPHPPEKSDGLSHGAPLRSPPQAILPPIRDTLPEFFLRVAQGSGDFGHTVTVYNIPDWRAPTSRQGRLEVHHLNPPILVDIEIAASRAWEMPSPRQFASLGVILDLCRSGSNPASQLGGESRSLKSKSIHIVQPLPTGTGRWIGHAVIAGVAFSPPGAGPVRAMIRVVELPDGTRPEKMTISTVAEVMTAP